MNSQELQTFRQAMSFVKAGNLLAANALLTSVRQTHPINPDILFWCAFTANDPTKAREAIEIAASVEPGHPALPKVRQWLAAQEQAQWGKEGVKATISDFATEKSTEPQANSSAPISNATVPLKFEEAVKQELSENEKLLWAGYYGPSNRETFIEICIIVAIGIGLAVGLGFGLGTASSMTGIGAFILAMSCIMPFTLGFIFLTYRNRYTRVNTLYVLSDQRALSITTASAKSNKAYNQIALAKVEEIAAVANNLNLAGKQNSPGDEEKLTFSDISISEVQKVEGLVIQACLREAINEYLSRESSWPSNATNSWPTPF